jgi:hypothetical protein
VFADHTDEVLREWLDADGSRLARLRDERVIGTTPQQVRRERT